MKQTLTLENLSQLSKETVAPAVSIYMPLKISAKGRGENRIRLQNLIKSAEKQIIAGGGEKDFAKQMLAPATELANDGIFWRTTAAPGLALFITPPQIFRYFELPDAIEEKISVESGFHLDPLREIMGKNRDFYLLVSSKNNLSLYLGRNGKLEKQNVPNLPKSIESLLPDKKYEKNLESHGTTPGGKMEMMHGQGGKKDDQKILIERYFKIANTALVKFLAKRKEPLMFAGTENLFSIFRQTNSYRGLLNKSLQGNFDDTPPEIIFKKALDLLKNAA